MADVVAETLPEGEGTVVSKTVETTVSEDGTTVITEETTIIEVNGVHEEPTAETTAAEVEVNGVTEVVATEEKQDVESENVNAATNEETEAVAEDTPEVESNEVASVEGEGDAEVTEEKKEDSPPKVILHQYPPGKDIPSLSPFCLKLETFLRINKIPYENQYGHKPGKKGKVPWIEYQGERVADSNFIIDYLNGKFEINLDKDFSSDQAAIGRAVRVMLEENTNWAVIYNRYVDHLNLRNSDYRKIITPASGGGIGFNVQFKMFQRKVRSYLDGHGIGKHSGEEIYAIAKKDLKAVSDILGDKEFLLGDKPSSFDCSIFGIIGNILYGGLCTNTPISDYITNDCENLIKFCDRMKELCWPDWTEMILGEEKAGEPNLKKGFSFRKKKTKPVKRKEEGAETVDEETAEKDTPAEETPAEETPAEESAVAEESPAIPSEETPVADEKPVVNGDLPPPEISAENTASEETATTPSEVIQDTKTVPSTETGTEAAAAES